MKLIKKLWNGDVSLVKTFWLYVMLPGLAILILAPLLENNIEAIMSFASAKVVITLLILAMVLLVMYAIHYPVSLFRSANKYTGSGFWKWLAIIISVLHGINNIATIFVLLPEIWELLIILGNIN